MRQLYSLLVAVSTNWKKVYNPHKTVASNNLGSEGQIMSTKNEEMEEAWGAFFMAHALAISSVETFIKDKAPLSLDEYDLLLSIARHPNERPRFSELAQATVFTRSGISRITKRLEERGLLAREECSEDKRGAYAVLTPDGKEAMKETWEWYSRAIHNLFEPCFSRSDAQFFKELNSRIIEQAREQPLVVIRKK
jgi:DNA-binding MarR family transcriptional regulator